MRRHITGFKLDEHDDWIALLDCSHAQHVRHQPPFIERPWVTSAEGRAAAIGQTLECSLCARFAWPEHLIAYRRTPEFTELTVPKALTKDHSTKRGVWARIVVVEGTLHYRVEAFSAAFDLTPGGDGIIVPEVLHHVTPLGVVRFYVEFYRAQEA